MNSPLPLGTPHPAPRHSQPAARGSSSPAPPRGARRARHLTVRWLDAWGWPPDSTASRDAAVVVAELATNAVLHTDRPGWYFGLRLAVQGDATLLVEATDACPDRYPLWPQWTVLPPPDAESGRGLLLVDVLATRWGVSQKCGEIKTVWCEVDLSERK